MSAPAVVGRIEQLTLAETLSPAAADAMRLAVAGPAMLRKLRDVAGECSECDGTGTLCGEIGFEEICPDCEDIRDVIEQATGSRS